MRNIELLIEKNQSNSRDKKFRKYSVRKNGQLHYQIKTEMFSDKYVLEMIQYISWVSREYKSSKIPIIIHIGKTSFSDKLVYILMECICYYMLNIRKQRIYIFFQTEDDIWSGGIYYSPLKYHINKQQFNKYFEYDLSTLHFRKVIRAENCLSSDFLSKKTEDIFFFLRNVGINEEYCLSLREVIAELIGNALEHSHSDCLFDIDITDRNFVRKSGEDGYFGLNLAIVSFSETLFFEPLKERFERVASLPDERYVGVAKAREYHTSHFNNDYNVNKFYTISSFQHGISGREDKGESGGRGLTTLIQSLADMATDHCCYLLSGQETVFFLEKTLQRNNDGWIGFNEKHDYLTSIPDSEILCNTKTFMPGTAYNLNFAIRRRDRDE